MYQMACHTCKKVFTAHDYEKPFRKYCSHKCFLVWRKQCFHFSKESKLKISKSLLGNKYRVGHVSWISGKVNKWVLGSKNVNWKGDDVGYRALHRWVRARKPGGDICEFCRTVKTTPKSIHLASKNGKYTRNLNDWIYLCPKCHGQYDQKNNLWRKRGKNKR